MEFEYCKLEIFVPESHLEAVRKALELFGHTGREPALRIRPDSFKCQNCVSCFVSTAFLCCGTVNDPEKGYNIEFLSTRYQLSQQLEAILAEHEFHPHRALRKGASTVYVKAGDHIEDLLTFMGAGNAAMRIMEQRMYNDMRNKTNRLNNCEMANIDKVVTANVAAKKAIEYLQQKGDFDALPAPLRQAAQLRLDWPDLSLAQLVEKSPEPISKSGLSHRLKKLEHLAEELRQRRNDV